MKIIDNIFSWIYKPKRFWHKTGQFSKISLKNLQSGLGRLLRSIPTYLKAGSANGLAPAHGATGRDGEAVPFFEDKSALFAHRGLKVEAVARARSPGDVGQMLQDLLFGNGQALGNLQGRKGLLQKQVFDSLTDG
jgi:hypothetical protein